jgi:hydroxyacylglutathione hydrolase
MLVQTFPSGPLETNAYVAACAKTKKAAIIDPAPDSFESISEYLDSQHLIPDKILLTHSHWDHIADASFFKKHYAIPVYIHVEDVPNLKEPGADGLPCWIDIEGVIPDGYLQEKDPIDVGMIVFKVLHTPGHTPGSVCLYSEGDAVLFSGDTLFRGSIGKLSFPTSKPNLMWPSLQKLAKLPSNTKVYPGHGADTTIGQESWLPNAQQIFGNSF